MIESFGICSKHSLYVILAHGKRITMGMQTTAGRSEYHGESVINSRQSGRIVRLPVKTRVFPHNIN
ncbi:MAG: hypothetical protein WBZ36_06850 [Candidatus Nitrosopolaris sp.]